MKVSKVRCGRRETTARPMKSPATTRGSSRTLNASESRWMSPSCRLKGTLKRLMSRKNQALVPTNTFLGSDTATRYKAITGPAALATMVTPPASSPMLQAKARVCGR